MVNEYKKIVLLKGLEGMQDYQFRTIKCLLRTELKLTKKMQDDYDRIQLADLMEDKFPKDAGLDKLIEVCEPIKGLEDITEKLKTEKEKVQKKEKEKGKTAMKNEKQGEISTSESFFISNESSKNKPSSKIERKQIIKTEGGKKKKLTQKQTLLSEPSGTERKKDENCLQTPLKPPPTPSSSSTIKTKRKQLTKTEGAKKKKLTQEEAQLPEHSGTDRKKDGDCLQTLLKAPVTSPSSYTNKTKRKQITKTEGAKKNKLTQEQTLFPEPSGTERKNDEDCLNTPLKPPATPPSSSTIKTKRKQITKAQGGKKKKFIQEQAQLQEPLGTERENDGDCLQTPHKPPPTPPSSFSIKTKRKQITKTEGGKKKKLTQKQTQFPEPSGTNIKKEEDCVHTPLKPPPTPSSSSTNKTPRKEIVPTEPAKEEGHQKGPKQVMVLKVTEPFTYDLKEDKRMFHATVATETEFFRVKVFDTALKTKFIPRNIIAISDYFGYNGFLEIYKSSCVSDVNVNQTMVISKTLRQRANATPKISYLFSQAKGTFVNGEFVVFKKIERDEVISYGIEDDTGKMEVVVYGQLTNIKCEPGSKLRLVCFELTSTDHVWQLRSVRHSYMQVTNARR